MKQQKIPIGIYGETGIGKTLDVANAIRKGYWLLCDPDGLSSVQTHLGFTPPHSLLEDVDRPMHEAKQVIKRDVAPVVQAGKCSAVIIDTGTELADRLLGVNMDAMVDGRQAYPATERQFKRIVRTILGLSSPLPVFFVVVIFQEVLPDKHKGGPDLPGSLARRIPRMFSVLLRCTDEGNDDKDPRVYLCEELSSEWYFKNRRSCALAEQPMDLRPILHRIAKPGKPVPTFPAKQIKPVDPDGRAKKE